MSSASNSSGSPKLGSSYRSKIRLLWNNLRSDLLGSRAQNEYVPRQAAEEKEISGQGIAENRQASRPVIAKNGHMPGRVITSDRHVSKETIALIASPFGLLVIATFRLLVVSNYNTTTAVTIASSNGYVSALFNSLIPLIPVLMPYLAVCLLAFRRYLPSLLAFILAALIAPSSLSSFMVRPVTEKYFKGIFPATIELLLALVTIALIVLAQSLPRLQILIMAIIATLILLPYIINIYPAPIPLLVLVISVLIVLAQKLPRTRNIMIAVIATLILFPYVHFFYPTPTGRAYYLAVLGQMWLPAERIVLSSGLVYYGYVLSSDTSWYTVMLANSKQIAYLPINDVVTRNVCLPENSPRSPPPLAPILYRASSLIPECSEYDVVKVASP
jgi:hypothetical protein